MTYIVFSARKGLSSAAIRAATFSRWSHVALVRGHEVIEAVYPKVRVVDFLEWEREQKRFEFGAKVSQSAWDFALSQVGKPYDVSAIFGIAFRGDWEESSKWFCSELVATAVSHERCIFRPDLSRVTPEMLYRLHPSVFE